MVTKIDRCSRNTLSFLKLQDKFFKRFISFVAFDLPHSTDLATNKLIATNLLTIATFENDCRKERQRQGIEAAKKMNKINFQDENLVVDWISFNIKGLTDPKLIAKIAFYLSKSFGFNSLLKDNSKSHFEYLIYEDKNQFQVSFLRSPSNSKFNKYWTGTTISFSGKSRNANYF